MKTKNIIVLPYDKKWAAAFEAIKFELQAALADSCIGIEHVGSTSVPGLSAKPIIDIDAIIKDMNAFPAAIQRLAAIGYEHEGDLGIKNREAFTYTGKDHLMKHHLYVCPQDSLELHRHLTFRNYLRMSPDAVKEYSQVKMQAAQLYPHDIDKYIAYKSSVIEKIYRACGLLE